MGDLDGAAPLHQADQAWPRPAGELVNVSRDDWPNVAEEIYDVGRTLLRTFESLLG